jgi:hypothetical protein
MCKYRENNPKADNVCIPVLDSGRCQRKALLTNDAQAEEIARDGDDRRGERISSRFQRAVEQRVDNSAIAVDDYPVGRVHVLSDNKKTGILAFLLD